MSDGKTVDKWVISWKQEHSVQYLMYEMNWTYYLRFANLYNSRAWAQARVDEMNNNDTGRPGRLVVMKVTISVEYIIKNN